jgi:hypothetical protein
MVSVVGKWEYGDHYILTGRGTVWTGKMLGVATVKPGYYLLVHTRLVRILGVESTGNPSDLRRGFLLETSFKCERDWPPPGTVFTILRNKTPGEEG